MHDRANTRGSLVTSESQDARNGREMPTPRLAEYTPIGL